MDHCLTTRIVNSILARHLFQDMDCCIGSSVTHPPDNWESSVLIQNQTLAVRLLPRSLGNFMWHQHFSLLALGKGLAHIAALSCL